MKQILKYPGSKRLIASRIINHFPQNYQKMTYLEPFFGSGSVFFTKRRSRIETINDLDNDVVNLFTVIRDQPEELAYQISMTPWSRKEYNDSYYESEDNLERARKFLIRTWMSIGTKTSDKTGWRNNIVAEDRTVHNFHYNLPDSIMQVSNRLKHNRDCIVQIENQDSFQLIERYNRSGVFMYMDPPYVMNTRHGRIYKHEFTEADYIKLLEICNRSKAKIMISGYESELYDTYLQG